MLRWTGAAVAAPGPLKPVSVLPIAFNVQDQAFKRGSFYAVMGKALKLEVENVILFRKKKVFPFFVKISFSSECFRKLEVIWPWKQDPSPLSSMLYFTWHLFSAGSFFSLGNNIHQAFHCILCLSPWQQTHSHQPLDIVLIISPRTGHCIFKAGTHWSH